MCFVIVMGSVSVRLSSCSALCVWMQTALEIEKQEEGKLKARYEARPMTGHSAFLAKRLAKGVSF